MSLGALPAAVLAGATLMAAIPAAAQAPESNPDLDRIRQRIDAPSPLRDVVDATTPPTFRVSVSEDAFDIRRFWGEPDAVGANVHAPGGSWHHEFQNMVVPDEFRGWGYTNILDNGQMAGVAAQSMGLMLAMKYLPGAIAKAARSSRERAARTEVRDALEAFYAAHPEARPTGDAPERARP